MGNSIGAIVIPTHFFQGELEELKVNIQNEKPEAL
jgi:hypothetical protein